MKMARSETNRSVFRYALLLVTALLVLPLNAATFRSDAAFHILYIDKQPLSLFQSHTDELEIAAGKHQLVLRYEQKFGRKQDPATVRSEPIVILLTLEPEHRIELKTDLPRDLATARQFAADPQFLLQDRDGARVKYEHYILPFQPGMQLTRNYLTEIAAYESGKTADPETAITPQTRAIQTESPPLQSQTSVPQADRNVSEKLNGAAEQPSAELASTTTAASHTAAATTTLAAAATEVTKQATPEVETSAQPRQPKADDPLVQLKQLYQRLDKTQRKAFQIWIIEQQ